MNRLRKAPKSFSITIFGCQQNWHDADHIRQFFKSLNLEEKEKGDIRILLACSVRQHAVDRLHGLIHKWQTEKEEPVIIIVGCMLETDRAFFERKGVYVCETKNLPSLLSQILGSDLSLACFLKEPLFSETHHQTYFLPIQEGCNRFCTYCATAFTRGRERSRPLSEIMEEIDFALKVQAKEVMLLGQTVTSYGRDLEGDINFAFLLKEILKKGGEFLISFLSPYPTDFTSELIDVLASSPRFKRVFHLPLQSGDDEILKKMNRKYTSSEYLAIIKKLKAKIPEAQITTDIIVGFPGETGAQFENTLKLCKKIGFQKAYIGKYSPRPGTFAEKHFPDDVSPLEKKRRFEILDHLINKKIS